MNAVVSVVIVNFNAGSDLLRCVDALCGTSLNLEIIVVDNGSSDSSLELLPDLPNLKIIKNGKNLGFSVACNKGIAYASAPFILFLNPDCFLDAETINALLVVLQSSDDVGMVGPLLLNEDGSEQGAGRRALPTLYLSFVRAFGLYRLAKHFPRLFPDLHHEGGALPEKPVGVGAISGACMLVKREALEKVGPWDEGYFLHCEDLDWCMRFHEAGWKILFVPRARVTHSKGGCSSGRPFFVEWHKHKGMIRFYRKFFSNYGSRFLVFIIALAVWFRFGLRCFFISLNYLGVGRGS